MTAPRPAAVDESALNEIDDAEATAHAQAVGARLRVLRHQLGWSPADVEAHSDQEITAWDLGAYESGEQAIPFFVFRRLVRLYGVTSDHLRPVQRTSSPFRIESDDDRVDHTVSPSVDSPVSRRVAVHGPDTPPVRAHCVEEPTAGRNHVPVGTAVMVRTRYMGSWTSGFEVAELLDGGYRLRRLSDMSVLRGAFAVDDVQCVSGDPGT